MPLVITFNGDGGDCYFESLLTTFKSSPSHNKNIIFKYSLTISKMVNCMSAETEQNIFGGYDEVDFEGMDGLVELIDIINNLDEQSKKFVLMNTMTMRRIDN